VRAAWEGVRAGCDGDGSGLRRGPERPGDGLARDIARKRMPEKAWREGMIRTEADPDGQRHGSDGLRPGPGPERGTGDSAGSEGGGTQRTSGLSNGALAQLLRVLLDPQAQPMTAEEQRILRYVVPALPRSSASC